MYGWWHVAEWYGMRLLSTPIGEAHVNAMSTNVRHFSTDNHSECVRMSASLRVENSRNQKLIEQAVDFFKLLKSFKFRLIT